MSVYFGGWKERADMARDFSEDGRIPMADLAPFPAETEVLFASDGQEEAYEGHALVIFERNGVLYEVEASHCSCNGYEGEWNPSLTTWAAQELRAAEIERERTHSEARGYWSGPMSGHSDEARAAYVALVEARNGRP